MKIQYAKHITRDSNFFSESSLKTAADRFSQIINREDIGFYHLPKNPEQLKKTQEIANKHLSKQTFVHVGIGGSSLGPEMLINALKTERNFIFINNIDPDEIASQLENIDPKNSVFYFVSKSGGTAETIASFSIIYNWLKKQGFTENFFKDHFIIATDPENGDLRKLSRDWELDTLEVPSNIGGRFSVLSSVGLFPAIMGGIDIKELLKGAEELANTLDNSNPEDSTLFKLAATILQGKAEGKNQTVLMPYSSKLKAISSWFTQLWAESLGKKINLKGEKVETGLTPIPAYGATDQHSQMQLFMEGPRDKFLILLEIENSLNDHDLSTDIELPSFQKLNGHSLHGLMQAELMGTCQALEDEKRPFARISIPNLSAYNLGQLILLLESLTVVVGDQIGINPFDQPGVEAGKRYAFKYLTEKW